MWMLVQSDDLVPYGTASTELNKTRTHLITHSFTPPLTHSLTHAFTHSLTHSPTHSLTRIYQNTILVARMSWLSLMMTQLARIMSCRCQCYLFDPDALTGNYPPKIPNKYLFNWRRTLFGANKWPPTSLLLSLFSRGIADLSEKM